MSKSELKEEKKKRKRNDDGAEEAPKKLKRSKKSKDPAAEGAPVATEPKEKKVKKDKKSKKTSEDASITNGAPEADNANGTLVDTTLQEDFIRFDDNEPISIATNGTLSRADSKKSKKDKKSKKSEDVTESAPAQQDTSVAGTQDGADEKADKKKSKKDKKSKKSKNSLEVVSGQVNEAAEAMDIDGGVEEADRENTTSEDKKKAKKDKKEKKSKKIKGEKEPLDGPIEVAALISVDEAAGVEVDGTELKSKKDKKSKKEKKSSKTSKLETEVETAAEPNVSAMPDEEAPEVESGNQSTEAQDEESDKKDRFIVFVGNLPYTATKESIEAHFVKLKPFEIRMRTYKDSGKFMGTCFIEFEKFDRMQTALQKYHNSVFSDDKSKNKEGRKLRVELSAGGGGNSAARKDKIKAKNDKLHDERQRRREKQDEIEWKQKERKEKKAGMKNDETEASAEAEEPADDNGGMHPARLAMMQRSAPSWRGGGRQRY